MKIGIAGASGLIGYNLYRFLASKGHDVIGTYCHHRRPCLLLFDITTSDFSLFDGLDAVIISSAVSSLDQCYEQQDYARQVNVTQTIALIDYLIKQGCRILFLSSDQVFDGQRGGYRESDPTGPVNFYGRLKVEVEQYIYDTVPEGLILRLSKTYSRYSEDGGMLQDIVSALEKGGAVKSAYNQIYNPTDVELVCRGIQMCLERHITGILHIADQRVMSRYDFALEVAKKYSYDMSRIEKVDFMTLPCREKRGLNSSLNVEKFYSFMDS